LFVNKIIGFKYGHRLDKYAPKFG